MAPQALHQSHEEQLNPLIRIRAPLRCEGIGSLDSAEDVTSGSRMAVRWLPLEANGEAAVQAMMGLPEHPTLPKVRHSGKVGSRAYVAMDFPEGRLLSSAGGQPPPPSQLLAIGIQLADALATVHGQGVVHGELSGDSILLVGEDRAFLWDLPLVIANRLTDRRGEQRLMQLLTRTAPYLSQERAQGRPATEAGDVYALGAALCFLAGATLPQSPTLAIVHQVATGSFRPEVPATLLPEVRELLLRLLARDPQARPSAQEAKALLLSLQAKGEAPADTFGAAFATGQMEALAPILNPLEVVSAKAARLDTPPKEIPVLTPAAAAPPSDALQPNPAEGEAASGADAFTAVTSDGALAVVAQPQEAPPAEPPLPKPQPARSPSLAELAAAEAQAKAPPLASTPMPEATPLGAALDDDTAARRFFTATPSTGSARPVPSPSQPASGPLFDRRLLIGGLAGVAVLALAVTLALYFAFPGEEPSPVPERDRGELSSPEDVEASEEEAQEEEAQEEEAQAEEVEEDLLNPLPVKPQPKPVRRASAAKKTAKAKSKPKAAAAKPQAAPAAMKPSSVFAPVTPAAAPAPALAAPVEVAPKAAPRKTAGEDEPLDPDAPSPPSSAGELKRPDF